MLATIIALSILLYHMVEEPMIRLGSRLAKRIESVRTPSLTEEALNMEPAP
jgi:peptidoglycan/LPS O-acetylase OafA/YrhL